MRKKDIKERRKKKLEGKKRKNREENYEKIKL